MLKRFDPDATLFRQGDPSDFVILILSGSAEVLREVGEDSILLGTVSPGEFVGEMGVLEGRPRSATVRAASPVEADLIERQAFLERVSIEPELARKVLLRMSVRLRDVEDTLARLYAGQDAEPAGNQLVAASPPVVAPQRVTLAPATSAVAALIGDQPIAIEHLPFTVGRRHDEHESPSVIPPDLSIPEPEPHRLSRAHFSLIRDDGGILVRDLNSTLGTIVNDRPLGHDFPVDSEPLHPGENTLVAGGQGSPFAFVVTLA